MTSYSSVAYVRYQATWAVPERRCTQHRTSVDVNDLSFWMPFLDNLTFLLCMCEFTCCTDVRRFSRFYYAICRRVFVYAYCICRRDFVCALLSVRCCRRAIILRVVVYESIQELSFGLCVKSVHKWRNFRGITDFKMAASAILDFCICKFWWQNVTLGPVFSLSIKFRANTCNNGRVWPKMWFSIWRPPPSWILSDAWFPWYLN